MSFAGDLDTERGVEIDMDGEGDMTADGRTPLDKTIDRIGMGAFSSRIHPYCMSEDVCRELPMDSSRIVWIW